MSATNFKTENNTYRKIIGNGLTYEIPRFQRDYSWTEVEWEDLWTDILGTIQEGGEPAHYMGYLVLQSQNEKNFSVIDGQQRLTTLALIVLAVLKSLQSLVDVGNSAGANRQRAVQIRQTYLGYLDPVTLISKTKLTLNRNNDPYFQTFLVPLAAHLPQRGFPASVHALRKAFEWYEKRVQDYAKQVQGDLGVALATLVETMSDRLFFTVISVNDELNAYKVFETLNARGVRLSSTDLLKNYLFSLLHKENESSEEMKALEDRWEGLVSRLGSEHFPDFLRTHWISRKKLVRQAELFKIIRAEVLGREGVFQLLRGLEEDLDIYLALTHPEGSHWSIELKDYAQSLKMFSVRQPFGMILAARRRFTDADFTTFLKACVVVSFRYNVIGNYGTGEQEHVYGQVAHKLHHGEITNIQDALLAMKEIYIPDEAFLAAFANKVIRTTNARNSRVMRYILCQLEKQKSHIEHDFDSEGFNIEHILPQNFQEGWQEFTDEEADAMTYRLGNMTLLERKINGDLGHNEFAVKKVKYAQSNFALTRAVAEQTVWNAESIAKRQKEMAKLACGIWKVSQMGLKL